VRPCARSIRDDRGQVDLEVPRPVVHRLSVGVGPVVRPRVEFEDSGELVLASAAGIRGSVHVEPYVGEECLAECRELSGVGGLSMAPKMAAGPNYCD